MARPGYIEARKVRDKEFYLVQLAKERLAKIDSLTDSNNRPYSDELKDVHRKDAERSLQDHQQALECAEAAFSVYSKLPGPSAPRKYYDVVFAFQLSVTRDMFDSIIRTCQEKNIRKTELIRSALEAYLNPQADGKPSVNVRELFSGKQTV